MAIIEVSAYSAEWAIEAQKYGASRVELCANIMEGGTTPSIGCINLTREALRIPLFVIIRPRGGNFLYNQFEFETMAKDIEQIKQIGADGVVLGLLTSNNQVDIARTRELVEIAKPMQVTFHRAFDVVDDPYKALEAIIESGCNRILTSGLKATAIKGVSLLKELNTLSNNRITLLPGCGINRDNINELWQETGFKEYHLSAKKKRLILSNTVNKEVNFNISGDEEDFNYILDIEMLKNVVKLSETYI